MNQHVRQLAAFAVAATAVFAVACDDDDEPSGPNIVQTNFNATLTGAGERPPVTTSATGSARLTTFNTDSVQFVVNVANIDSVTFAHVHAGDANTPSSGSGIIVLLGSSSPARSITAQTAIYQATIMRTSTFPAPFTFDSLLTRLNAGTAYVNVHTRRNPLGEVRGQLAR